MNSINNAPPFNRAPTPTDTPAAEHYPREEVQQLRNNRAPGEDGIPVKVYKMCLDSLGP